MDDMTLMGRTILSAQPFSRLLRAELTLLNVREAEIHLVVRDELKQQHGFVHGGVISYLADNSLTFACGAALGGEAVVTSEFKINYIRPATGDILIAKATVLGLGKSQAVARCEIYTSNSGQERICAAAQGTVVVLPKRSRAT